MERKQGFFSALKEEVVRGLSPSRSRANSPARTGSPTIMSSLLRRKKSHHAAQHEAALVARSGSLRPLGETLTPLMEGPDQDGAEIGESKRSGSGLGQWMKGQLGRTPSVIASSMGYNNSSNNISTDNVWIILNVKCFVLFVLKGRLINRVSKTRFSSKTPHGKNVISDVIRP